MSTETTLRTETETATTNSSASTSASTATVKITAGTASQLLSSLEGISMVAGSVVLFILITAISGTLITRTCLRRKQRQRQKR